jgi:Transposase
MDHIGIDVHKKESQLCILSEDGERREPRVRTTPARFADVLGDRPRARILLEASTESEWVARCLERLGHEVIVADPNFAPMYATRTRKIKTDRRDARALAEACRLGAYRPAHRLSDAQRYVRGRLTVRDALVRTRTQYISVIRALLRQHGWRVPTGGLLDLGDDRPRQGVGQRIHLVRPVQRDRADATLVVDTDEVGHGSSCLRHGRIWCVRGPHAPQRHGEQAQADRCEELAAVHYWITSSARASTAGGIVRPRALAVFRLMTSSNFVGCSTGRSLGFAPLRILST